MMCGSFLRGTKKEDQLAVDDVRKQRDSEDFLNARTQIAVQAKNPKGERKVLEPPTDCFVVVVVVSVLPIVRPRRFHRRRGLLRDRKFFRKLELATPRREAERVFRRVDVVLDGAQERRGESCRTICFLWFGGGRSNRSGPSSASSKAAAAGIFSPRGGGGGELKFLPCWNGAKCVREDGFYVFCCTAHDFAALSGNFHCFFLPSPFLIVSFFFFLDYTLLSARFFSSFSRLWRRRRRRLLFFYRRRRPRIVPAEAERIPHRSSSS